MAAIDKQALTALRERAARYLAEKRSLTAAILDDGTDTESDPDASFRRDGVAILSAAVVAAIHAAAEEIADRTGEDVSTVEPALQAQYGPQYANASAQGLAQLQAQLDDVVQQATDPADPDQEPLGEDDGLPVKSGWVKAALLLAGGLGLGMMGTRRGNQQVDDVTGPGSGSLDTVGGVASGDITTGMLADNGIVPVSPRYIWDYGDADRSAFPPHEDLDGYAFDRFDDEGLVVPPGYEWLDTNFLCPQEHAGCMCSIVINYGDEGYGDEDVTDQVPLGDFGDEAEE